jgi:hypothetical protein
MCSLNYTSDRLKRFGYVNPNLVNQLALNPQINENSQKFKTMSKSKQAAVQRELTEKRNVTSTHLENSKPLPIF